MSAWLAVTLELEAGTADAFGDALLAVGAQSVALEAGRLSAILESRRDPNTLVSAAAQAIGIAMPAFTTQRLDDRDWVRESQAQFAPLRLGRLWVGASWHEAPAGAVIVSLDPGMAFGTGSHPTTRLVLSYLEKNLQGGERVLDYGCGSGILAIAAAKLGAAAVDATDLDPLAVLTTAENAALNQVHVCALAPEALAPAQYDVVVSNILLQPLVLLAPLLAARVAPRGRIALAGVLESQAEELVTAYAPWFDTSIALRLDGWALVTGDRR